MCNKCYLQFLLEWTVYCPSHNLKNLNKMQLLSQFWSVYIFPFYSRRFHFFFIRTTKMPWLGKVYEFLDYINVIDLLRPAINQFNKYYFGDMVRNLDDIDKMTPPRVFKSHLPFYLLNPQLIDTCKVILFSFLNVFLTITILLHN